MKVYIGPYRSWIGPYQIAEFLFAWYPKKDDGYERADFVHDFGTWLAEDRHGNDSWLMKLCNWIHNKKERKIKIHIDRYDSWGAHNTASLILHPLLKQLRDTKHGSGFVDDEDVPEELRSTNRAAWYGITMEERDNYGHTDNFFHMRYEWVLNEVIWALEQDNNDWEDKFHSGKSDLKSEPCQWDENGKPTLYTFVEGPNHTATFDQEGYMAYQKRIDNGFRLMGKYWQTFWD